MTITIKHRWNDLVLFASETATTLRQAILEAVAAKAVLSDAVLSDAVLSDAVLSDAVLSGAVLSGAVLRGAVLRGAVGECRIDIQQLTGKPLPVPKIENIHQTVLAAIQSPGNSLDMSQWHSCETTHCRAGWVVHLAGPQGKGLENKLGPAAAAMRIYLESDPDIDVLPKWHVTNDEAMADMIRQAEHEKALAK